VTDFAVFRHLHDITDNSHCRLQTRSYQSGTADVLRKEATSFLKFSHYSFSTISTLRTLIKTLIFFWQTFCLSTKRRHAWCRWHGSCV